jgi:putative phosphoribosyl transferase
MDRFRDRIEAGARLSESLAATLGNGAPPVVLGVPRGGVVVAAVVADRLACEIDVLAVEKVGAPWNRELALGAVGEGDALWLDPDLAVRVDDATLQALIERERLELAEKLASIRRIQPRIELTGRPAIIVDDGVATGSTVRAALMALAAAKPARRVLAVPVGPPETLAALEEIADLVVCPLRPAYFQAVGLWYESFEQVSQRQVEEVFERRRRGERAIDVL